MKISYSLKRLSGVILSLVLLAAVIPFSALTTKAEAEANITDNETEPAADEDPIVKISLTCADPQPGQTAPECTVQAAAYASSEIIAPTESHAYWEYCDINSPLDADWIRMESDDTFSAGLYYRAIFTDIFDESKYTLSQNVQAYINGKASTTPVADIYQDDNEAQYEYVWYVFSDTPTDTFYYDPVQWAVMNGVTTGVIPTVFSPDTTCSRAQFVTFLWRTYGSPEPETTVNPFTDVAEDSYYYKAVLWAYENNITTGLSSTVFGPDYDCLREQIVTFLWRACGEPPVVADNPFTDVASDQYYTDAVLWAVSKGITTGTTDTTFSPANNALRGQVVTFLYRTYAY